MKTDFGNTSNEKKSRGYLEEESDELFFALPFQRKTIHTSFYKENQKSKAEHMGRTLTATVQNVPTNCFPTNLEKARPAQNLFLSCN